MMAFVCAECPRGNAYPSRFGYERHVDQIHTDGRTERQRCPDCGHEPVDATLLFGPRGECLRCRGPL